MFNKNKSYTRKQAQIIVGKVIKKRKKLNKKFHRLYVDLYDLDKTQFHDYYDSVVTLDKVPTDDGFLSKKYMRLFNNQYSLLLRVITPYLKEVKTRNDYYKLGWKNDEYISILLNDKYYVIK